MPLMKPTGRTASEDITHQQKLREKAAVLEEMGQEDERKAAKVVIEEGRKDDRQALEKEAKVLEDLSRKSRFKFQTYKQSLAEAVGGMIRAGGGFSWNWQWYAWSDDRGVGLAMVSPKKRRFARAFQPVNIPKIDLHACAVLCQQAENLVEKIEQEEREKRVAGAIWRP